MRKVLLLIIAMLIMGATYAQLTGTKNIPGDYATLALAITDLNTQGVGAGGVTFNIAASYTENITTPILLTATGTVANPIVFQKSGAGANPLITRTDAGTLATTTLGGQGDAVIILQGSDYTTFDAVDVAASNSGVEYGYYLRKQSVTDGCKNVTIKNATVTMTKGTSAYVVGIYSSNNDAGSLVGSATGITVTSTGGRHENVTITGNTISNVFSGIILRGYNHTVAPNDFQDQNFSIGAAGAPNTISNYAGNAASTAYGIYLIYHTNPTVSNNTVNNAGGGGTNATSTLYGIFMSSSNAAGNVTMNANSVTLGQGATSGAQCIYISPACTSVTITNNTFSYGTFASTSTSYLIYCSNATNNITVTGNQTTGTITKTGVGQLEGFYNLGGPTGGTANISNNNFSNIIFTGGSTFYGIRILTSVSQIINLNNNTISNITGGTSALYGIYQGYGAAGSTVNGNSVSNFTGSGAMYGLYLGATTAPVSLTASDNVVSTLTSTGAVSVYGIFNSSGTVNTITKNKVYNLIGQNASGTAYGIYISGGTTTNIYNNFVSDIKTPLANAANPLSGIYLSGGTTTNVYYNTVYLNGTSTGALFGSSAFYSNTTSVIDVRNNIFINVSTPVGATGFTCAYRRSSSTLTSYANTSNNNNFYAGTPGVNNLIYYDGTNSDQTLAAYQTRVSPRDALSVTENSPFVNVTTTPYDLHMKTTVPTYCESGGTAVTTPIAVTDDYDGNPRNSNPDIGADEFAGIAAGVINPTLSAAAVNPSQINLTFTPNPSTDNVLIVWNLTGTFVAPVGAPPAVGNAFAGGTVLYLGTVSPVNHTGLTANTPYYYKAYSYNGSIYSTGVAATATTPCSTASLPQSQGFNTLTIPSCWSTAIVAVQTGTKISFPASGTNQTASPSEGTNFVMYNSYSSTNGGSGSIERLISAPYTTTGISSVDVKFDWFESGNTTYVDPLEGVTVEYSTDGITWNSVVAFPRYVGSASTSGVWSNKTVTLPAGAGNQANLLVGLKFRSAYGYNCYLDGFQILASPPMVYTSSTTTQTNTSAVVTGSTNQQVIGVQIVTDGSLSPISASSFTFSTNGSTLPSDIVNAKLWSTGTSSTFATTTQIGDVVVAPNGSFTISSGANLPATLSFGTNYFWLTYDIAGTAIGGDVVDAECNSVTVGGTAYIPTVQAPAGNRMIKAPLNGVYTIGASQVSPNYTTLTAGLSDLNILGVSGPVTFQLAADYSSATETYPLVVNAYPNLSAVNTFTLKPMAGVAATISGSSATALIKVYGTDYATIDGVNSGGASLTFTNTNSSGVDIWVSSTLTDGATNNTIKNCSFSGNSGTTTIAGILAGSGATLGNAAEVANSNNTIQNCTFKNTQNGVYIMGVATFDNGWNVLNSTFGSAVSAEKHGYRGIFIGNASNFTVSGNTIIGVQSTTSSSATTSGIQVGSSINGGNVNGNFIGNIAQINTTGWGSAGILLSTSTAASNLNVFNNKIYDVKGYGYAGVASTDNGYGIMIDAGGGFNIYYNSVNMNTSETAAGSIPAAINISASVTAANSIVLKNNIFNVPASNTVGTRYAIYCAAAKTVFSDIDNNDYYSAGTLGYLGSAQSTLAAWKTATGKDLNSLNVDPAFVSGSDLHTTVADLNNGGAAVGGITTDFASVARTNPPDIGVYEFTLPMTFVTTTVATAIGKTGATLNAMVSTNNEVAATSFDYGLTNAYGSTQLGNPTPIRTLVATSFNGTVGGLAPNTTYHFRAKATSTTSAEVLNGTDLTFVTLPDPTITGSAIVCQGSTGNIYSTEAGNSGYVWTISAGGVITAGDGTHSVTVTWTGSGAHTLSVNYNNSAGFPAPTATTLNVTVNPKPSVTNAPPSTAICNNTSTSIFLTSDVVGTTFAWTASVGSGNAIGFAPGFGVVINQILSNLNFTNSSVVYHITPTASGCSGDVFDYTVTIYPTPDVSNAPLSKSQCNGVNTNINLTSHVVGTTFTWTATGSSANVTGYADGSGATIGQTLFNTGSVLETVTYTITPSANGCTGAPAIYVVSVYPVPVPVITGSSSACIGSCGIVYSTAAGMTNYQWSVSAGGTITAGGGSGNSTVTVCWNTVGPQTVSVNYTTPSGCTGATSTVYPVTVNPLPVPTIAGAAAVCIGATGVTYSTEPGMTGYTWVISGGGTITSGSGTNSVTVNWNVIGLQTIRVSYTNGNGCVTATPTIKNVTVTPLPVPTITGSGAGCANTTGNIYSTEAGMTNYIWSVSAGGTITSGGTVNDNSVTVTWSGAGTQTISVSYTSPLGCAAATPTVKTITINPLPSPTLSGSNSVCQGTSVVYTTEAGMTNYTWSVSAGGSITAGGGAGNNSATITWGSSGPQTVSVNYTNGFGCTALAATVYNITVNPLPVPTIGGSSSVCVGATGVVYTTQAGMSNYQWSVSAGGTITSGGGAANNSVTVTWTGVGAQSVSVGYTNLNGCTSATPTLHAVTVNPLPTPSLSGNTSACIGSTGNVYTTQAGQVNYVWNVSAGGTITAGGTSTSSSVTVTWTTAGAKTVTVNYTSLAGCVSTTPATHAITVNPLPVPTLNGPNNICNNPAGNVYATEAGMSNYTWSVSAGGTITAGGTSTDNSVTVTWSVAGPQSVTVNYTDGNGCRATASTSFPVTVNALPVPTITGLNSVCIGATGVVYTTQAGMSNYNWLVSPGGLVTAGGSIGDNTVIVTWGTAGPQTVSVNYANLAGCSGAVPTVYNVNVNPLPVPTLTGPAAPCVNGTGNVYTTDAGKSNYTWVVSGGGTITAGGTATSNSVTVTWTTLGPQSVSVNYTDGNGCTGASSTLYPVTVGSMPAPTLTGTNIVCLGASGMVYTTEAGMTNYTWNISAGGTITSGGTSTSNTVTVTWTGLGNQTLSVNYTNLNGCSAALPTVFNVTVDPSPVPTISGPATVCENSNNIVYSTEPGMTGYTWNISAGGIITSGAGTNTVVVNWLSAGVRSINVNYTSPFGCPAGAPTVKSVTVVNLPTPTINGPWVLCEGTSGNVYTTESGQSGYTWSVSAGGVITAGAGTNSIVVTWNTPGVQTVTANYANAYGCFGATPSSYLVNVEPKPVPTITGPASICAGSTGSVYTTQGGMTNYTWNVSAGGIITAGVGTNSITVSWTTAGAQTVSVGYTNSYGCSSVAPTVYNVVVAPMSPPTISGPSSICVNTTSHVYSTEAGMSNYAWSVSAGGTITAGGTTVSNTITITWNTVGAQTVSVNYINGSGCTAAAPTVYNVMVNALPTPTITGVATVCVNSTGNIYSTQPGMTGYTWSITGGSITSGAGTNAITVIWNTVGTGTLTVNYTNVNGCTAPTPAVYNVTVNPLPTPTITGPTVICAGVSGNVYTTQSGMVGYTWNISAGGTITSGAGTNSIVVTWNTAGAQTVSVNYTNLNGCTAALPTVFNVTVNALPVPTLTGPSSICVGTTSNVYTTQAGMSNYIWSVSAGGTITSGGTTTSNTVTVTWTTTGAKTVCVNYTNTNGCTAAAPTCYNVTVNALPTPTISGPVSVCAGSVGNTYSTQAGMTGYVWSVSAGGTITAGSGSNAIAVTWNTPGAQTVTVNYTNGSGCTATTATVYNVTVNALPTPTISGPANVCLNSTSNTYTTQAGMNNYIWSVSAGGIITAGGGLSNNTVTITWNTTGAKTVCVNYTNSNGCTAATATCYNVTVNPLPVPTINGPATVCTPSTGNVYTTESGMTGYTWTLSAGGTITAGAGTNTITVNWTGSGTGTVCVNYTNANGCTAATPTCTTITFNPRPNPTISGNVAVCAGTTGVVYTTDPGMTGYSWSVSGGGAITAGVGTNAITVTWNTAGAQTVTVNYNNVFGCSALTPTTLNVTVNPLPVPTITGPASVCLNSTGNIYTTQAGMTNYVWTVSAGGTITSGGTSTSNTVTVTWNTTGAKTVCVSYTNGSGCTASVPVCYNVTVSPAPVPTVTGSTSMCVNSGYYNYTTETGMSNYVWTISAGGTITFGQGTNVAQVTWNTSGAQWVAVNYTNTSGCSSPTPTQLNVTVNPLPSAAGNITGQSTVCAGAQGVAYTVGPIANAVTYVWTLPAGATIATGNLTNSITVNFAANASAGNITVYGDNLCGSGQVSPPFAITVNSLPEAAGVITGDTTVCQGTTGAIYSVAPITNATGYAWMLPSGATIVAGNNTNTITVDFAMNASSGNISVHGINSCGGGTESPSLHVTVSPIPPTPIITQVGDSLLMSNIPNGNQWYFAGAPIPGATSQYLYTTVMPGEYWCVVTWNGCSSDTSVHVVLPTGVINPSQGAFQFNIYPVPNDGHFTVSVSSSKEESFTLTIYNNLGALLYKVDDLEVSGLTEKQIDLRPIPDGMYTIMLENGNQRLVKKVIITK